MCLLKIYYCQDSAVGYSIISSYSKCSKLYTTISVHKERREKNVFPPDITLSMCSLKAHYQISHVSDVNFKWLCLSPVILSLFWCENN